MSVSTGARAGVPGTTSRPRRCTTRSPTIVSPTTSTALSRTAARRALPSRTDHGTIAARDWFSVGGGEGGYIAVDPKDNNILYVGDTAGSLVAIRPALRTVAEHSPSPMRTGGSSGSIAMQKYRFPWTPPLIFSPLEPTTLYLGAQVLLETVDGGLTWKEISPDLTGDTRKEKRAAGPFP